MVLLDLIMWITLWITLGKMWITFLQYKNRLRCIEQLLYTVYCQGKYLTVFYCVILLLLCNATYPKSTIYSVCLVGIYTIWGIFYIFQDFCRTKSTLMCSTLIIPLKIESEIIRYTLRYASVKPSKIKALRDSAETKNSRKSAKL